MVNSLSREERILASVRPFRLSTAVEISTLRRVFIRISGLKMGQFAENNFGFPFIPFPEIDPENIGRVRLSPSNIDKRFIFHPIYWLDPRITAPTDDEMADASRWSIRMFYELLSFGLLNPETLQWLNPAVVKGVVFTPADIDSFLNDAPSSLDAARFGDGDRLPGYASSDVLDASDNALEKIRAIQQREVTRIRTLKDTAIKDARLILSGDDAWPGLYENLVNVCQEIEAAQSSRSPISTYIDEVYSSKVAIGKYLSNADDAITALSYDLIDGVSYSNQAIAKFSAITALVKRGKGLISKYEQSMDKIIKELFGNGNVDAMAIARLVSSMHDDLSDRLSLAYRNSENVAKKARPVRSIDEMEFDSSNRMQQAKESDFS